MHCDTHRAFATMFMEKVVGAMATVSIAWVGMAYILMEIEHEQSMAVFYMMLIVTLLSIGCALLSLHPAIHSFILDKVSGFKRAKFINKLSEAYSDFTNAKMALFYNYLMSVAETLLQLMITCIVGLALGIEMSILLFSSVIAVSELIRRLAVMFDGWGLATGLQIVLYSMAGVTAAEALALVLVTRAVHFFVSLPAVFVLLGDKWKLPHKDKTV